MTSLFTPLSTASPTHLGTRQGDTGQYNRSGPQASPKACTMGRAQKTLASHGSDHLPRSLQSRENQGLSMDGKLHIRFQYSKVCELTSQLTTTNQTTEKPPSSHPGGTRKTQASWTDKRDNGEIVAKKKEESHTQT